MELRLRNDDGATAPPTMFSLGIIVVGIIVLIAVVFLGLCVASLFLPVILALVGLLLLWKGTKGQPQLIIIGLVLLMVGVLLWMWGI